MVVAPEAGRRNPAGDRLGGSLGARFEEAREAGAQQSLSEPFFFSCHLPQGFPTHREKHKEGQECSWTFRVLGAHVQARSPGG